MSRPRYRARDPRRALGAILGLWMLVPGPAFPASAEPAAEPAAQSPLRFEVVAGADGVPLNVVSVGDPANPGILLVHGIGQSYVSWEQQLAGPLADEFHVVAFDLRGHGNSAKPWNREAYTDHRRYADDVRAVMEATGLTRPLLVGWSYGTLVVADYLRAHGDAGLGGIVLTGAYGGFTPPPPPPPPEMATRMTELRSQQASPRPEDNIAAAEAFSRLLTAREMPPEYYARAARISLMLPGYARRHMMDRSFANQDLVEQIGVPLLVVVGGRDGSTPEDAGRDLAAAVPGARVSVYPESGHSPFAEAPERFNRELAAFAREVLAAR